MAVSLQLLLLSVMYDTPSNVLELLLLPFGTEEVPHLVSLFQKSEF